MLRNADSPVPNHEEDTHGSVNEYLQRATAACAAGDSVLGIHLYLTAFEEDMSVGKVQPSEGVIQGLKKAWALACVQKERSLAEYIFEKMEPYLSSDEITVCAGELQDLALDKLEEFGLSREDLEDVAEMISQDFFGLDSQILKVEHIVESPSFLASQLGACFAETADDSADDALEEDPHAIKASTDAQEPVEAIDASKADKAADDAAPAEAKTIEAMLANAAAAGTLLADAQDLAKSANNETTSGKEPFGNTSEDIANAQPIHASSENPILDISSSDKKPSAPKIRKPQVPSFESPMELLSRAVGEAGADRHSEVVEALTYDSIAGYDSVVQAMHDLGIGMHDNDDFQKLVGVLNARHGLDRMPALDTLLFRAPAREDANRFVAATIGELKLPVLRMHMEENFQGMPVLCVTTQAENAPKLNAMRNAFEGGGVLVLEDIDVWGSPLADFSEEVGGFLMMQLSRGVREAINLIRSAVENPDVYVLATMSSSSEIDAFFLDMLDPLSFIDIDYPTPEERDSLWLDIAREHPSIRSIDRSDLVRLSANMPRFDIYMAAREAVEDAYKMGLMSRRYCPVTREILFDKLAAYQPLESDEYCELEEEIIRDFQADLSHIDDLLDGE